MRVVIGEDDILFCEGMVRLLTESSIEVVGQAADAQELVSKVAAHRPDVVLTDVRMPPDNTDDGLRAAIEIRRRYPAIGVLVLSKYIAELPALQLIADNAASVGYLLKDRVADLDSSSTPSVASLTAAPPWTPRSSRAYSDAREQTPLKTSAVASARYSGSWPKATQIRPLPLPS